MRNPFHKPGAGRSGISSICLLLLLAIGLSDCGGSVRNTPPPPPPPSTDTTPPTVSVTAPSSGSTVSGTVTVSASASDNVAVAGVQFQIDGSNTGAEDTTAPYSVSWNSTGVANGTHTLTAVARDTSNNSTTSAGVNVTVDNTSSSDTTPPTVSITAPSPGSTVSGTITVSASASDNVAVAGVQFQVDGSNTGAEDTTAPYSISLSTTSLTNGNHTLTAVARDSSNNTATSSGVTITVDNQTGPTFSATITLQPAQTKQTWIAFLTEPIGPTLGASQTDLIDPTTMAEMVEAYVNDLGFTGFRWTPALGFVNGGNGYEPANDNADPFSFPAGWLTGTFYPQVEAPYFINAVDARNDKKTWDNIVDPVHDTVVTNGESFTLIIDPCCDRPDMQTHWKFGASQYEEEYAEFAEAMVQWIVDNYGFEPDYWTIPVNEPGAAHFSSDSPVEAVKQANATASRFSSNGWATKTNHDENVTPGEAVIWTAFCDGNATCKANAGLVSWHGYDYSSSLKPDAAVLVHRNTLRDRAATWGPGAAGVPTAMLEICCKSGWNGSYNHGLQIARDIYWNMTEGDVSMWMPHEFVGKCGTLGCPTGGSVLQTDAGLTDWFKLPNYYIMRQYAKWIRPGYVRVDTACTAGCTTADPATGEKVKTVAFKRPDGSYVIVAINDQDNSASLTFSGFPAGTYQIEGVEPTVCTDPPGGAGMRDRCTPIVFASQTISAGQNLVLTLPARSIVTFH